MRFSIWPRVLALLLFTFSIAACARKQPLPAPEEAEPRYYEHSVMYQGETMGLISRWYTGTADNWKEILTYNPGLNIYRMKKGDLVKIPDFLLKRRQPMPRTFVDKFYASAAKAPAKPVDTHQAEKQAETPAAKTDSKPALPPEQALPSVSREKAPAAEQSAAPSGSQDPVPPEAASLSAKVRAEVDKEIGDPSAAAQLEAQPPAAVSPRAKTREELLRELLDEGANPQP